MKNLKVYAMLTFFSLESVSIAAQSILKPYFDDNKDSLIKEAAKLIHTPEPTLEQTNQPTETSPEAIAYMGSEQVFGLKIFHEINNHEYDSLPVLFAHPPEAAPWRKYTHQANTNMTSGDDVTGLKTVKAPMLVLIGSNDETFYAEALQKTVLKNSLKKVHIIENEIHNGVIIHNLLILSSIEL